MARPRLSPTQAVRMLGTGISVPVAEREPARRRTPPPAPRTATGMQPTRVLGLDLAIGTTGWCLLVSGQPAAHGSFKLPDRAKQETLAHWLERRAADLKHHVTFLVANHRPEIVAYEYPDTWRRSWSGGTKGREFMAVQGLSRAEGMLVALWSSVGNPPRLMAVSTSDAKRTVTGRVDASKDQVAWALRTHRGWDLRGWTADEVDAGAVALTAREETAHG